MLKNKLSMLLITLGIIGINVLISKWIAQQTVETELVQYASENPSPQIAVIDIETFVKSRVEKGEDPARVIRYVGLLSAAAVAERMLVLDKKAVIAAHPDYSLPEVSPDELEKRLRALGKAIPSLSEFEKKLNAEKSTIEKMFTELDQHSKIKGD